MLSVSTILIFDVNEYIIIMLKLIICIIVIILLLLGLDYLATSMMSSTSKILVSGKSVDQGKFYIMSDSIQYEITFENYNKLLVGKTYTVKILSNRITEVL